MITNYLENMSVVLIAGWSADQVLSFHWNCLMAGDDSENSVHLKNITMTYALSENPVFGVVLNVFRHTKI